jgi:superfamily I DNA/RNA helicase
MKIVEEILARNPRMKLMMMGDIDQTIFTWRGSDLVELDKFIKGY